MQKLNRNDVYDVCIFCKEVVNKQKVSSKYQRHCFFHHESTFIASGRKITWYITLSIQPSFCSTFICRSTWIAQWLDRTKISIPISVDLWELSLLDFTYR